MEIPSNSGKKLLGIWILKIMPFSTAILSKHTSNKARSITIAGLSYHTVDAHHLLPLLDQLLFENPL
jgi:hypothetical protein